METTFGQVVGSVLVKYSLLYCSVKHEYKRVEIFAH